MEANTSLITKPSALIPLAMALICLGLVLGHAAVYGTLRQADEGTAAHLFQLLMVVQVPFAAFFAIKWLPRNTKQALIILALQAGIIFAAFASLYYFEHN